MTKDLINRITYHLSSGGLFNPELADHLAVRNLLMECREALAQPEQEQLISDQINYGMSVTQGGKRIDPMSIYKEPEQEPVATDWERIARVQDAKLRAMCNEAGGFEKLCEVMDKYERTTPPQRKPLTDAELERLYDAHAEYQEYGAWVSGWFEFARAIEAAHGIKGEA